MDQVGIPVFITTTVVFVTILLLKLFWYYVTRPWHHLLTPSWNVPILGHLLAMPTERHQLYMLLKKWQNEYGNVFLVWILWKPLVVCINTKMTESILTSQQHITKAWVYGFLHDWLGTGLLTSRNKKWRKRRKLLTPAFHFDILKDFANIFEKHSSQFVTSITEEGKEILDGFLITKKYALGVICDAAMGVECYVGNSTSDSKEIAYVNAVTNLNNLIAKRYHKPWCWSPLLYKCFSEGRMYFQALDTVHSFVKEVTQNRINNRCKELNLSKKRERVFLDMLLDAEQAEEIDMDGIMEEVNTFMFEGHDTVSACLAWTLYLLGRNEEVQTKVFMEVRHIASLNLNPLDRLKEMGYINCVIKESLRLHPPVPFIIRQIEEDSTFDSIKIPKGTELSTFFIQIHRDEQIWQNPLRFIPERFQEDAFLQRKPFTYLPFSAGPRNCIGQRFAMMEIKLFLYHVILNFEITSLQREEDLLEHIDIIHRSENDLQLMISKRQVQQQQQQQQQQQL